MTENEIDQAYKAKEKFHDKVREAFREMKKELSEEQFNYIVYLCQDGLSLFSPWMNKE